MMFLWIKALHIISVICWMAGLFYLPRLFVYHAEAKTGSELSETFKVMERRLLRFIMNPAMIASYIFGSWMLWLDPRLLTRPFMWIKLVSVFFLTCVHMMLARYRRDFAEDRNLHSHKFFRVLNEVPTALLIIIIFAITLRIGG